MKFFILMTRTKSGKVISYHSDFQKEVDRNEKHETQHEIGPGWAHHSDAASSWNRSFFSRVGIRRSMTELEMEQIAALRDGGK
jgi:hypothetical protein